MFEQQPGRRGAAGRELHGRLERRAAGDNEIRSRRFDSADQPLGGEKLVSTSSEQEDEPAVAAAPDGSLVVAWESTTGDDRRLPAPRGRRGQARRRGRRSRERERRPTPTWRSPRTGRSSWCGRPSRASAPAASPRTATPLTGDVVVGAGDASAEPSVTIDSAGRVFVAWVGLRRLLRRLHPRLHRRRSRPPGTPSRSSTAPSRRQEPDVVATPEGFVVVFNQADMANQAYGRRFTAAGAPVAAAVPLSPADGREPHVARGADGGLVAGWWDGSRRARAGVPRRTSPPRAGRSSWPTTGRARTSRPSREL